MVYIWEGARSLVSPWAQVNWIQLLDWTARQLLSQKHECMRHWQLTNIWPCGGLGTTPELLDTTKATN
jgi:hypothetical protein